MSRRYVLYSSNALTEGTENAHVYTACESDREARKNASMFGDCACYSYELAPNNKTLIDERFEWVRTGGPIDLVPRKKKEKQ